VNPDERHFDDKVYVMIDYENIELKIFFSILKNIIWQHLEEIKNQFLIDQILNHFLLMEIEIK